MLPGNVDPRRADKQQRYKPPPANSNATPGEDLTPDYMNILGPETTNAQTQQEKILQNSNNTDRQEAKTDEGKVKEETKVVTETNASHVIPTSPRYGVAVPPTALGDEVAATEAAVDHKPEADAKEMHSTPSRNDRFKVVKIESIEPFRRGRWKCMDYLDQTFNQQAPKSLSSQQSGQQTSGSLYLQTQSLPPQQFQQMLMQGYTNQPQFYQQNGTVQQQMVGQQFCYPQVQNQMNMQNVQSQTLNSQMIGAALNQPMMMQGQMQAQYVNNSQPQYLPPGVLPVSVGYSMPANFQNLQFVGQQQALTQTSNSAFVPATNNMIQGQTYAGQPLQTQQSFVQQQGQTYGGQNLQNQMSMVNGHPPSQQQYVPEVPNNLQSHVTKNAILNQPTHNSVLDTSHQSIQQQQQQQNVDVQSQNPSFHSQINNQTGESSLVNSIRNVPVNPDSKQDQQLQHQVFIQQQVGVQNLDQNVYTNPQFVASVGSITSVTDLPHQVHNIVLEAVNEVTSTVEAHPPEEDPSKINPVVNAIDNKIEQAMDLVKSHLMFTVREEVIVLKEKIAELMDRIQQLETENNFLRSQNTMKTTSNSEAQ